MLEEELARHASIVWIATIGFWLTVALTLLLAGAVLYADHLFRKAVRE